MEIRQLKGRELNNLAILVPGPILRDGDLVLGCFERGQLIGTGILTKMGYQWTITWLYIDSPYRELYYGGELLDSLLETARDQGARLVRAFMDGKSPDAIQLANMLADRDFTISFDSMARVTVTREQLQKAVFFTNPRLSKDRQRPGTQIIPLKDLPSLTYKKFIENWESRGKYLISRADFAGVDPMKSRVLVSQDRLVGLALVEDKDEGQYELSLCFVEKKYRIHTVGLIKAAAKALLEPEADMRKLTFSCVGDGILKLAEHVFQEKKIQWDSIISGEIWL